MTTSSPDASDTEPGNDETTSSTRVIVGTGVVAGLVATAATMLVAAGAIALDVPMQAAASADEAAEDIPLLAFASLTLPAVALGVVLALALARWARRPQRTFVVVTVALTVASLVLPLTAHEVTTATQVVLELTHVVAAAIVIPALASRLPRQRRR
jgi:hypothetical protein